MGKILEFLENLETRKYARTFKIWLAPIWFLFEYLCYKTYWKLVLEKLVTDDEIFEFLDKNDFALWKNRLVKMDLTDNINYLKSRSNNEKKEIIKKEYVETFSKLIEKNISLNVEDLISLTVDVEDRYIKENGEYYHGNIFEVSIQYYRLWMVKKSRQYFFIWFLIVFILTFLIYLIFKFI